jgi:hypothetical protein
MSLSLQDVLGWARDLSPHVPTRRPDQVIGPARRPYMLRWYLIPKSDRGNLYLHVILCSDDDRALHDHPWDSTSLILAGQYIEVTPHGNHRRQAGDMIVRCDQEAHRLIIPADAGPAVTLFVTGPKTREWGFHCPQGWVPWRDFDARGCAPEA